MGMNFGRDNNMMEILAAVKEMNKDLGNQNLQNWWEGKYRYYLEYFFKKSGADTCKFDSFEIAAILAFSMKHGFENRTEYSRMQKCISDFLVNPFSCTVRKIAMDDGKFEYVCESKEMLQPLEVSYEVGCARAAETIDILEKYVYFSAKISELEKLIAEFKKLYEKYSNL